MSDICRFGWQDLPRGLSSPWWIVAPALILTTPAVGAETEGPTASANGGLHFVDWAIIAAYACLTIGLGIYFGRQQGSAKEYFVGSGKINPLLVGVSLFATLLSTISYLSMPGEGAGKGPVAMVGMTAFPFVFFVVAFLMLPVYMRQRVTSAYELLEERLGLGLRLLGASMFLALRLVWMTLLVYLTAKAMTVMMGLDPKWIPTIVVITGLVSVVYTTLGGLRAVIVTDFIQTVLLFGGALLVVATVTYHFGGFGWFPTQWHPNWDTQPVFSFDPQTRVSVVGTILSIFCWYVATLGGDQTSVQRFMATQDLRAARRAVATQLSVATCVQLTLFVVGFALLGYFQLHRDQLPPSIDLKQNADDLFPRYVAYHLPVGVSGLVVAAMFAAAMSSIDSGVNSITAVVLTDFLERFGWTPRSERGNVRAAQLLALAIGVTVVIGSSYMKYIEGNITAVTNKTVNLLTTPIFALFFFRSVCAPRKAAWRLGRSGSGCRDGGRNRLLRTARLPALLAIWYRSSRVRHGVAHRDRRGIRHGVDDRQRSRQLPVDCAAGFLGEHCRRLAGQLVVADASSETMTPDSSPDYS